MKKIFFIVTLVVFLLPLVMGEVVCPYDTEDCSYPGDCGRYFDENNDGLCDFSQDESEDINADLNEGILKSVGIGKSYYFSTILIITLILYFITWGFAKTHKIKMATHRKIWNLVLLISFLISGILGILLVLRIQYGFSLNLGINQLFLHVETGIVMAIVTLFHITWHIPYFKTYFKWPQKSLNTNINCN
jgi:hypothetical protein